MGLPGLGGELYHPLEFYPTSHIDLDWGAGRVAQPGGGPTPSTRARCFVILFGVGRAETEGIYSLRALAKEEARLPQMAQAVTRTMAAWGAVIFGSGMLSKRMSFAAWYVSAFMCGISLIPL